MGNLLPSLGRRKLPLLEMPKVGGGGASVQLGGIIYAADTPGANYALCDGSLITPSAAFPYPPPAPLAPTSVAGSTGSLSAVIQAITFGGGVYVAAGQNNSDGSRFILSSTDAATWTQRTGPASEFTAATAIYASGLFVLAGFTGKIWTSPDGINWTARASGVSTLLRCSVYAYGLFIIAGDNAILTSPDGVTWTSRAVPAGVSHTSVLSAVVVKGRPYLATDGGLLWSSDDGISWSVVQATGTGFAINGLAYGRGLFVAVGGIGISTSRDGKSWAPRERPGDLRDMSLATYSNGVFFIGGLNGSNFRTASSEDGVTWKGLVFGQNTAASLYALNVAGGRLLAGYSATSGHIHSGSLAAAQYRLPIIRGEILPDGSVLNAYMKVA